MSEFPDPGQTYLVDDREFLFFYKDGVIYDTDMEVIEDTEDQI